MKISTETVMQMMELARAMNASESIAPRHALKHFLDGLPPEQLCEVVAMVRIIRGDEEDFETAVETARLKVKEAGLTTTLVEEKFLECHLQDALRLGWKYFEEPTVKVEDEEE